MPDREEQNRPSGITRAEFVKRLAVGAFAVPAISSFKLDSLGRGVYPGHGYPNQTQGNQTDPGQSCPNQTQQWPNQTDPNQTLPDSGVPVPQGPPVLPPGERSKLIQFITRLIHRGH